MNDKEIECLPEAALHNNWLTTNIDAITTFVGELFQTACEENKPRHPVIDEFRELIDTDPVVRMYITQMITQACAAGHCYPRDVEELLTMLNQVLTQAPKFNETALVGCPMSAIVVWTMSVPAGFAAYRNEKINAMFKKLLAVYRDYLNSPDSLNVINDGPEGWKCKAARKKLKMKNYKYNKNDPHWGYTSWNDFFSRSLAPGAREPDAPEDNKVIVSACDSTFHFLSTDTQRYSRFWIKSQPYSLQDMLGNDELVDEFVGGTVYQAYLNPFNYHRWHSPVSGTIRKAYVKEGLYFSQATSAGVDPTAQGDSEGYVAHVQTRAIIFIDCDDPAIGLVVVMPVGMVEISSCLIDENIQPGHHVEKSDELGCFQYGGSTHCLIFRPGVIKKITAKRDKFYEVGEQIAIAN